MNRIRKKVVQRIILNCPDNIKLVEFRRQEDDTVLVVGRALTGGSFREEMTIDEADTLGGQYVRAGWTKKANNNKDVI